MKITNVETLILSAKVDKPWKMSTAVLDEMHTTLVRISTDEGLTGIGECIVRVAPEPVATIVDTLLQELLIGQDPFHIEGLWEKMYNLMRPRGHWKGFMIEAISGVDIALWDLMGKALNLPLYKLLGSQGREWIPVYASSVYIKETREMVREAEALIAQGHKAIKIKIGADPKTDLENIRAIRRAVGDDVQLMADANCGYDTLTALWIGRQLEEEGVFWLEEPLPPEHIDGYAELARNLDLAIACGESDFTRFAFREFIVRKAVDIIQPNVARAGGFTECRRIAALASAFNIPYAPHTGASSAITTIASLHLAAAIPNLLIFELMFPPNPLREHLLQGPLVEFKDGAVRVPQGPGLGVELDPEALARFQVR